MGQASEVTAWHPSSLESFIRVKRGARQLPTPRPTTAGTWPRPALPGLVFASLVARCTTETAFGYFWPRRASSHSATNAYLSGHGPTIGPALIP